MHITFEFIFYSYKVTGNSIGVLPYLHTYNASVMCRYSTSSNIDSFAGKFIIKKKRTL